MRKYVFLNALAFFANLGLQKSIIKGQESNTKKKGSRTLYAPCYPL